MMKNRNGFTLLEVIVAGAIFLVFATGAYQGYIALQNAITSARYKALAADLVNARFETVKNMPYSSIGIPGGTPDGIVPALETVVSDGVSFQVSSVVENVDDPFDSLAGTGDLFPNDYKLVEITVSCSTCKHFNPVSFTGLVAPKNLESL